MTPIKSVQVIIRLHIFLIFSFLEKMLSFLSRYDNIFARNETIGKKCKRTITWMDFIMFFEVFLVKIVQIELGTECHLARKNEFFHPAFKVPAKIWSYFSSKIRGHPKLMNKNVSSKIILPHCAQSRSLSLSLSHTLFLSSTCQLARLELGWYYLES